MIEDLFLVAAASIAAAFMASLVFNKCLRTLDLGKGKRLTVEQKREVITKAVPYVLIAVVGVLVPTLLQMLGVVSYEGKRRISWRFLSFRSLERSSWP
ncbi:hypothetical protein [Paracoccus luteus]|uniref:hypothetical protein n=1 Tax=Paracoccus luteus TaxID=2508543 RepID=UPI00106F921F|nr:hypothetical protein [Paracoccus luteus]